MLRIIKNHRKAIRTAVVFAVKMLRIIKNHRKAIRTAVVFAVKMLRIIKNRRKNTRIAVSLQVVRINYQNAFKRLFLRRYKGNALLRMCF